MSDASAEMASLSDPAIVEYNTPLSNIYNSPQSATYNTPRSTADAKTMSLNSQDQGMEPVYAAPDEMNIIGNKAYTATNTFTMQEVPPEAHFYSVPGDAEEKEISETGEQSSTACCCKFLIVLIYTLLLILAIGVGGTALTMVLYNSHFAQPCDCQQTLNTPQITDTLTLIELRLNQTGRELAQSQNQVQMLSTRLAEFSNNITNAPVLPSQNISNVPYNCTTSIEAQCTVDPALGACVTPCTDENRPGSVAISFQCLRLESDEFNPLVGVLDVTNGLALCICYVIEVEGTSRTHPVECVLKVTRCPLVDLNV